MSTRITSKLAGVLAGGFAGAVLIAASSFSAQALPSPAIEAQHAEHDVGVMLAEAGCGIGWWRGPEGRCHPDRERVVVNPVVPVVPGVVIEPARVCPLGTHLGPRRRECIPN